MNPFRKKSFPNRRRANRITIDALGPHRPLLARLVLGLVLCLGWYRKPTPNRLPDLLLDPWFVELVGIQLPKEFDEDGDELINRKWVSKATDARLAQMLERRLEELANDELPDQMPLLANIDLLSVRLGLSDADKAVLTFAVAITGFGGIRSLISPRSEEASDSHLARVIAMTMGLTERAVLAAIGSDSPLVTTGIIRVERDRADLENKIDLMEGLSGILLMPDLDEQTLIGHFLRPAGAGSLNLSAFPHLATDIDAMKSFLGNAIRDRELGTNILLYGPPGTGKTELVKALAVELGIELFEIRFANSEGNPIKGKARLRAYNLCQRIMANMPEKLLMFDEIEDVLPSGAGMFLAQLFGGGSDDTGHGGKAWINRTLERNPVPSIWITNNSNIDPAYLRRFDYSVEFPVPPQTVRLEVAKRYFGELKPSEQWLESITASEMTTPAQLERAARVARIGANGDRDRAIELASRALDRSASLLGQKRMPSRNSLHTAYDLRFVNTDTDIPRIVDGLRRRPRGSFCFYGPAGTGKSELGRHLADLIGKPVLLRRASDLLSKWVGESEQNIARMFAEARQRDKVLILDEADSFLADRRGAHASWEVTQVNELLTQMEAFEGVFICTTNLMQKLDQASLRRFAFKVKFDYLTVDQRWAMFRQELERLQGTEPIPDDCEAEIRRLDHLTPGDFAVAARQYDLWGTVPTASEYAELLRRECVAKGASGRGIGFTA